MGLKYKSQKLINRLTFGLSEMGSGFTYSDIWYNLKYGFKNLKSFFWVVWRYRPWDYTYNLLLLKRGLEIYLKSPNNEIDEDRIPKENRIKRVIQIIDNLDKSPYVEMAEQELGKICTKGFNFVELSEKGDDGGNLYTMVSKSTPEMQEHNSLVYKRSYEIENEEWDELFDIIKSDGRGWWI